MGESDISCRPTRRWLAGRCCRRPDQHPTAPGHVGTATTQPSPRPGPPSSHPSFPCSPFGPSSKTGSNSPCSAGPGPGSVTADGVSGGGMGARPVRPPLTSRLRPFPCPPSGLSSVQGPWSLSLHHGQLSAGTRLSQGGPPPLPVLPVSASVASQRSPRLLGQCWSSLLCTGTAS